MVIFFFQTLKPKNHIFSQSKTTKCRRNPSFFVLLVSLSLTSLLSRPVYIQRALSGHPNPTRICEWDEGSTGEASPGGRGASRFIYLFGGLSRREGRFSLYLFFGGPSAMRAGGGTERAASFGWRAPCLGQTHLGSSARRASPGLQQGPSAGSLPRTHSFVARGCWTHSFERRLPGIRKDQRGPVRRPQIPAPKPAESHGGARRTGGLSAWTILSQ